MDSSQKKNVALPFTGVRFAELGLQELKNSPHEQYSHMAGKATRKFRCSWGYRWDAVAYLLGWSSPKFNASGTFTHISRILPDVYKPAINIVPVAKKTVIRSKDDWDNITGGSSVEASENDRPWLWATEINSIVGAGRQQKIILPDGHSFSTYTEAHLEVSYEVRHYRLLSDKEMQQHNYTRMIDYDYYPDEFYAARFCSFHPQPILLHMTVPQDGMFWNNDAVGGIAGKQNLNETKTVKCSTDIQLRWYGVPALPDAMRDMLGCINDRSIEIHPPGHVRRFNPHTLIYIGFRLNTYRQVTGEYVHDISYLFSHFKEGHNSELCFPPGNNYKWTNIRTAAYSRSNDSHLTSSLYPERDFNELFRLPNQ